MSLGKYSCSFWPDVGLRWNNFFSMEIHLHLLIQPHSNRNLNGTLSSWLNSGISANMSCQVMEFSTAERVVSNTSQPSHGTLQLHVRNTTLNSGFLLLIFFETSNDMSFVLCSLQLMSGFQGVTWMDNCCIYGSLRCLNDWALVTNLLYAFHQLCFTHWSQTSTGN